LALGEGGQRGFDQVQPARGRLLSVPRAPLPARPSLTRPVLPARPPRARSPKFVEVLQKEFADYNLTYSIGGQISFDVFPKVGAGGGAGQKGASAPALQQRARPCSPSRAPGRRPPSHPLARPLPLILTRAGTRPTASSL
jgi:hypothetical protein